MTGNTHFKHSGTIVSEVIIYLVFWELSGILFQLEKGEKKNTCQKMNNVKIDHFKDYISGYSLHLNALFKSWGGCN